jgi:hypothetical protein
MKFLNCDLFFKHHVEKINDFSKNIPEFNANYFSISGVLSECYQFIRQFVVEQKEYVFKLKSFKNSNDVGFRFEFTGEFQSPGENGTMLPFNLEGGSLEMIRISSPNLDKNFMAECLEINNAILSLNCEKEIIKFEMKFPLPKE